MVGGKWWRVLRLLRGEASHNFSQTDCLTDSFAPHALQQTEWPALKNSGIAAFGASGSKTSELGLATRRIDFPRLGSVFRPIGGRAVSPSGAWRTWASAPYARTTTALLEMPSIGL